MRVVKQGWKYAGVLVLLAIPSGIISPVLAFGVLIAAIGVLVFFRDPDRHPASEGILSPADGKVSIIREEGNRLRVGVYMNVLNVHVNRSPIQGQVASVKHRAGAHRPAFAKDSDRNERVTIAIAGRSDVEVDLIAGAFARRITPYPSEGDTLERGDRIGHIAFGSRADVLLPAAYDRQHIAVSMGDRVRAGESILAS